MGAPGAVMPISEPLRAVSAVPDLEESDRVASLIAVQQQRPAPKTFAGTLLNRDELANLPQPRPLISDTLDQHTVALLEGRNSTGKSFLALDWACCLATGKAWQGRAVDPGWSVLYVAAEGAHGLHKRVSAWEYAWGRTVAPDRLAVLPVPVNFFTGRLFPELLGYVTERMHSGAPIGLTIVDTWARSMVGGKENDNSDSTLGFDRLDALRAVGSGGSVLAVHHTDKADNSGRGASALEDNADTVYRIKADDGVLELSREKRKDGPSEDRLQLRLKVVDTAAGSSCVLENAADTSNRIPGRAEDLMSAFRGHFADIGCTKKELRDVAGLSPASFSRSLTTLVGQGFLVNVGSDRLPFYKPGAAA